MGQPDEAEAVYSGSTPVEKGGRSCHLPRSPAFVLEEVSPATFRGRLWPECNSPHPRPRSLPGVYGKGSRAEKLRGEASSSGTLGPSTPPLPPWHPNCSLLGQVGSQTLRPEAGGKGCRMLLGRESSCIPGTTVVASTGRSPWVHCVIVGSPPGQLDWIRGHDEPEWMAPAAASGIFPVPVGG
jgi:hypothetical protein